ncbi:MAG: hypothetical protein ACJ70T_06570, partial [Nitrososphaera sp.]
MKLIKNRETIITALLLSIMISVLINNGFNYQQVIAQQQLSPEETQNEILRGRLQIGRNDNDATTTESSVQPIPEGNILAYESPPYEIRTQYPNGWEIIIQNTSNSMLSIRFNSPPENDTDNFRENVR